MSTRSIIAKPTEDGSWRGRYCHWDGYPSHMIPELSRIIAEKGYDRAVDILINFNVGWSSLTASPTLGEGYKDGRFKTVSDYGVAYTVKSGQGSWDDWIGPEHVDSWCEYAYVLYPDRIDVWEHTDEWAYKSTVDASLFANA